MQLYGNYLCKYSLTQLFFRRQFWCESEEFFYIGRDIDSWFSQDKLLEFLT